jgi:hypothetical protein
MLVTQAAVVIALSVQESITAPESAEPAARGEPGAVLAFIDVGTGSILHQLRFDATEWAIISSLAVDGSDVIVGGTFAGTLRTGSTVVTSGGRSDGFIAKVRSNGAMAWLRRLGGHESDSVVGVAARDGRIAIGGTAGAEAELGGWPIASGGGGARYGEAFLALLDPAGQVAWSKSFGEGAIAGVAIDRKFRIAVATNLREPSSPGSRATANRTESSSLVRFISASGHFESTAHIQSSASVGIRSVVAVGERTILGGVFSGTLTLGKTSIVANGSGDAFVASVDATGKMEVPWHVAGPGSEEIVSLTSASEGFLVGLSHTRGFAVNPNRLPPPNQPGGGAVIAVGAHRK